MVDVAAATALKRRDPKQRYQWTGGSDRPTAWGAAVVRDELLATGNFLEIVLAVLYASTDPDRYTVFCDPDSEPGSVGSIRVRVPNEGGSGSGGGAGIILRQNVLGATCNKPVAVIGEGGEKKDTDEGGGTRQALCFKDRDLFTSENDVGRQQDIPDASLKVIAEVLTEHFGFVPITRADGANDDSQLPPDTEAAKHGATQAPASRSGKYVRTSEGEWVPTESLAPVVFELAPSAGNLERKASVKWALNSDMQ
jgi:hypothetical protein